MGTSISKLWPDKDKKLSDISHQEKEIVICNDLDPRSPNTDIARTPLQEHSPGKRMQQKITKQVNLNNSLMTTPSKTEKSNLLVSVLQGRLVQTIDPRSPSSTIIRTPIYQTSSYINTSVDALDCSITELSSIPPKTFADKNEYGERSIIKSNSAKLLETNLDYLETNLDNIDICNDGGKNNASNVEENNISVMKPEEYLISLDPRSPSIDILRTPLFLTETDIFVQQTSTRNIIADPRSPSIGIDRTPIILPNGMNKSFSLEDIKDLSIIDVAEDITNTVITEFVNVTPKIKQKTIKNEVINQIYVESEHEKVTPRRILSGDGKRTPLSCVKNTSTGHVRSKSANTSTNKTIKSRSKTNFLANIKSYEQDFKGVLEGDENKKTVKCGGNRKASRIPTLKERAMENRVTKKKLSENTPLVNQVGKKNWDQDRSIVI